MTSTCRKCGDPVEQTGGRGRPRSYCSVGCRRAAEREIRRADRAIQQMEDALRWARINNADRASLAKYETERVRLEERLAVLLDDEDVKA